MSFQFFLYTSQHLFDLDIALEDFFRIKRENFAESELESEKNSQIYSRNRSRSKEVFRSQKCLLCRPLILTLNNGTCGILDCDQLLCKIEAFLHFFNKFVIFHEQMIVKTLHFPVERTT
jgi:hypothetical protein